ncbi:MAG: hypothetical protein IRZ18_08000 [Clostridia bacterium]|nr:hypothetical protein [Clostridia bacterium]
MRKTLSTALVVLMGVTLMACAGGGNGPRPGDTGQSPAISENSEEADAQAVRTLVEGFGQQLQNVSLLAPEDVVSKAMEENYSEFVSPELLAEWQRDPAKAPGRLTSSPWPDRIEIKSIEKRSESSYEVKGDVIEVTSVEKANGGVAARRPITLVATKADEGWRIDAVTLGTYEDANAIVYKNTEYGFTFTLPESWKGYSIVTGQWEGAAVDGQDAGKIVETGPMISIRHPQWTAEHPRQDIPIMIFTLAQWDALQQGKFHIGAAPINPSELGRNDQYVFALPARYNYSFPTGYEEVEQILEGHPLQAVDTRP